MIALHFAGRFECRLPTDPDPSDEPRGVSGFAWAVAGEPDLDRIVRFQNPSAQRSHTPRVGVYVSAVVVGGTPQPDHVLTGAPVDLVGEPRFEGRNGIVAQSGTEPIVPFTIRIECNGVVLQRDSGVAGVPYTDLQPAGKVDNSAAVVGEATGDWDFAATLRAREKSLSSDRAAASDDLTQAALDARLTCLRQNGRFMTMLHNVRMLYAFPLKGRAVVRDRANSLGNTPTTQKPWMVEFWLGGWDGDALTAFVDGWLSIPERDPDPIGSVHPLEFTERLAGPPPRS